MRISPVSRSYWRMIKEGLKSINEIVGEDKKEQVKWLAKQEVNSGNITADKYQDLIGEPYSEIEEQ